ncbi:uncharacterized protein ZBAI_01366 [Zygosaccharomyces bailii ISA1307]|nr:uncharacterized protein ZBAI_01366 [Zygosaccharomyces bailii ISA1307]
MHHVTDGRSDRDSSGSTFYSIFTISPARSLPIVPQGQEMLGTRLISDAGRRHYCDRGILYRGIGNNRDEIVSRDVMCLVCPDDPEYLHNWSTFKKMWVIAQVTLFTCITNTASRCNLKGL